MPIALVARVVEVLADLGEDAHPRYRYGSGCIVFGRTVLTAAHVVAGAQAVRVRDPDKVMHDATVDARFIGDIDGPGPDLALVTLEEASIELAAMPLARVDRGGADPEPVDRCRAVGYPWFAQRSSPEAVRDTVEACGYVPVLSKLASGLLSLIVSVAPRPLPPESETLGQSEWAGMSGAPVVAGGCLFGVVTEHAVREGPSAITITPLSALDPDPDHRLWGTGVSDPGSWWQRLGVPPAALEHGVPGSNALERLPARTRPEPAYRATVREIQARTRELRGRTRELRELVEFSTSSERYRWLIGGAWTGKTALLAATVAALPDEVQVVSYFLSRREADADQNRFLAAVVAQLAYLLDQDPPVADRDHFRDLWQRACSQAEHADQHLLLIVDGLDEDLHPAGSLSVAALLPDILGERAHMLVSSRPYPELPSDVPVGHPLLSTPPTALEPFEGAEELALLARQEIDELKRRDDDGLAIDVLGFLTAAAGPLAVEDLAALSADSTPPYRAHTRAVRRLVREDTARSLQAVGSDTDRRYQFAHASLLEHAQNDDDLSDRDYRQHIHGWAREWATKRWPAAGDSADVTPRYLLDSYPATLTGSPASPPGPEDLDRLAALVSDIGWIIAAVANLGVDQVLAAVRTAAKVIPNAASVGSMLRVLESEAHHLRHPSAADPVGYAATALGWRALTLGENELAAAAADKLSALPAPQLIPLWTTERVNPEIVYAVGGLDAGVSALAVTADGLVVAGTEDGRVCLLDPKAPGDPGRELGRHRGAVQGLAVTPDGLVISCSDWGDDALQVWDPGRSNNPPVVRRGLMGGDALAVAVSLDGLLVLGGGTGTLKLWDPRTNGAIESFGDHGSPVRAVAVTPEGLVVSGGKDGLLRLWDPRDPRAPSAASRELGRHEGAVTALTVTPEGLAVSAGDDGSVRIWEPGTTAVQGRVIGRHHGGARALAVTRDGFVVSTGTDHVLRLWDPDVPTDPGRELGGPPARSVRDGHAVAVTPDGLVASVSEGMVRLWDPRAAGSGAQRTDDQRWMRIAISSPDLVVSLASDGGLRLWNPWVPADPGREIGRQEDGWVLSGTPDGLVVCGDLDGVVRLWTPSIPGDAGREIARHDGRVEALAVSAGGLVVSAAIDGVLRLWDPRQPDRAARELGRRDDGPFVAVAFTPDEMLVSTGWDGELRLWDPRTPGDCGRPFARVDNEAVIAVTPRGLVASGTRRRGVVQLWDPSAAGDPGRELGRHDDDIVVKIVVTPDELILSIGADRTVRLWDPRGGPELGRELVRHDANLLDMALAPDGRLLISTGDDITVFELNTTSSTRVALTGEH